MSLAGLFTVMLTVLFIGLKLTGHINWSWLWVLSPLWINFAACMVFLMICILVVVLIGASETRRRRF